MKHWLIIAFAFLMAHGIKAQEGLNFSLFAGASISNINSTEALPETNARLGLHAGVAGNFFLSETWSLKGSIFYNQNGWVLGDSVSDASKTTRTLTLHYITLAITPEYHFGANSPWFANIGPYFSYLASANQGPPNQVRDLYNTTDLGAQGSIGYLFPLSGESQLSLEIAQQVGFTDIIENNGGDPIKNSRTSLTIGYIF